MKNDVNISILVVTPRNSSFECISIFFDSAATVPAPDSSSSAFIDIVFDSSSDICFDCTLEYNQAQRHLPYVDLECSAKCSDICLDCTVICLDFSDVCFD
jgi:hypothetical protein